MTKRFLLILAAVFGFLLTLPQTAEARTSRRYRNGYGRVYYGGYRGYYRPYRAYRYRPYVYRPYYYYGDPYYYGPAYYRPYGYYGRPGVSFSFGY